MASLGNSLPASPKVSCRDVERNKERRSYAYVTAVQRNKDATKRDGDTSEKCKKTAISANTDSAKNTVDVPDDEDKLVQSSLKINGRQNLTVSAGSGSVFYFHYPLPCDEQTHDPTRRSSAPPLTAEMGISTESVEHGDIKAVGIRSSSPVVVNDHTDGIAFDEDTVHGEEEIITDHAVENIRHDKLDADGPVRTMSSSKVHEMTIAKAPSPVTVPVRLRRQRRLVLIGYTGGGKSETGNSILCDRDIFDSLPGFASITKECKKCTGKDIRSANHANDVVVVDTPGLFDTNDDPEKIAKKITECIINVSPGPHAILLVTPIARMTTEVQQAADGLRKLFGDRSLQYMIVVFTHLDAIKRKKSIKGIEQMVSMAPPALYRILQECNSRYVAFDNTLDPDSNENCKQVADLLNLVDDMVHGNGGQCYTNDLLEEANRLMEMEKKRHEKEIEEKFKEREARIRGEYEKHLAIIDTKQRQLEEVQEKRRQLEANKSKELQIKIERQQSQIRVKEEEHAKVLKTEKAKYSRALESMNTILDELHIDLKTVELEKEGLVKRETELSNELLSAIAERDTTTKYLDQLEKELQRELNVPVKIDPSKPPKSIVQVVTKRVRRCPIL